MITVLTNKPELVSIECNIAQNHEELCGGDTLIACCTSVIVDINTIKKYNTAFNIHPAPPTYPGRDPHHWAFYDGASQYGVTLHIMTEKVDAGDILMVDFFPITQKTPLELRDEANRRAFLMLDHVGRELTSGKQIKINENYKWSGKKRTRKDTISMCNFSGLPDDEIYRRKYSFSGFDSFFKE